MEGQLSTPNADDTTRERLRAAALELFNAKGFAATTVREIAQAAGVTKPVVYYYFGNKEGIYRDIMSAAFQHMDVLAEKGKSRAGSCFKRILAYAEEFYDVFEEHLLEARLIYALHYGPPEGAPTFDHEAFHEKFSGAVAAIVEDGLDAGEVRSCNVADVVFLILSIISGAMEMRLVEPDRAIGKPGLQRLLRLVFDGIAAG